jgi:hypothetical protein
MKSIIAGYYGLAGLLLVVLMELAALLKIRGLNIWVTPVAWYGYILLLDWLIHRREGRSPLTGETREFILMFPLSIGLWCIFELHNLLFGNWEYVGLPENRLVALLGFAVSFATILPALYVTDRFLRSLNVFNVRINPHSYGKGRLWMEITLGLFFIAVATLYPSIYTGPLIWPGYLLLFAPLNYLLGLPSLLRERERGDYSGTLTLLAAGYICGLVWEFLNYWAGAKWIYHVPYLESVRIFEMPVIGFLGFGPFAIAFLEMYYTARHLPGRIFSAK